MQKKVVQIEKENIGSENFFMESEDGRRLEAGNWELGLTKLRMMAKAKAQN
jgi:hypothetical protein